ncbi:eukaryotic translation initiation factor 3 subunit L-like [Sinocyclocheilus grahami]|uniref:eukaryotic translation initiation factor 3 subunit L-like n=1 Tax=Sinocyclocheilus grahami TaxID=75366 RepID=UPI0007AD037F|nr:PREDICTED: eukaryotic translation initiation factor 3 subunit L-like [Sinocyclocheilus grahami]
MSRCVLLRGSKEYKVCVCSAGDPKADLAYERQYEHQQTYHVIPEVIKNFLQYFHKTISDLIDQKVYELQANRVTSESIEQKIYEIQDVYENSWNKLTDRFFKTSPWPEAEAIASLVGNDAVFLILYKELYYRHIYAKVSVSVFARPLPSYLFHSVVLSILYCHNGVMNNLNRVLCVVQINKQNEQMHGLLAIALTMYPMRIDESIHTQLREKYGDKMLRMQKGIEITLYTTMPVAKLAGFLDMSEQEFRIQLLVFKHKMKNLVWTSGISALDGEFQSASEVDFYIDKDMIHIADTKVARRYGDFFIRQIHKFEELNRTLKKMPLTGAPSSLTSTTSRAT